MSRREWSRRPWMVVILCSQIGTAAAQTSEAPSPVPQVVPAQASASPPAATVWLLPDDQRARLTYFIELDANGRLLPFPNPRATWNRGHFEPFCAAPCTVQLPLGSYSLGLSNDGGKSIPVSSALLVNRDTRVVAHYQSNRWRLVTGIALIITAVVATGALAVAANLPCPEDGSCSESSTAVAVSASVMAAGTVAGILLIATSSDTASVAQQ